MRDWRLSLVANVTSCFKAQIYLEFQIICSCQFSDKFCFDMFNSRRLLSDTSLCFHPNGSPWKLHKQKNVETNEVETMFTFSVFFSALTVQQHPKSSCRSIPCDMLNLLLNIGYFTAPFHLQGSYFGKNKTCDTSNRHCP